MAGDMLPIERPKPSQTPEAKQKRISAAAKERRRSRRGERRSRSQGQKKR
jgi:23S rRNA pseudouridine955/2504/2580 synthase